MISNLTKTDVVVLACREFRTHSCDWFYSHLQKRFHDFGSAKVVKSVGFNSEFESFEDIEDGRLRWRETEKGNVF